MRPIMSFDNTPGYFDQYAKYYKHVLVRPIRNDQSSPHQSSADLPVSPSIREEKGSLAISCSGKPTNHGLSVKYLVTAISRICRLFSRQYASANSSQEINATSASRCDFSSRVINQTLILAGASKADSWTAVTTSGCTILWAVTLWAIG